MADQTPEEIAEARIEAARLSGAIDLDLSDLGLTALPDAIASLTALQTLELGNNQLTALPDAIANLTALQTLGLGHNQLTALPDAIASLTALQNLKLGHNQLTALPDAVASLTALEFFNLEDNQLTALPDAIESLTALSELYLHGNDALGIPLEILGPTRWYSSRGNPAASPADILSYYFRTKTEATRPLNEAKIILVGQGGVGKSSLVKRLMHDEFDENETKTEGIDILRWSLPTKDGSDPVRLNIWDFGGQEIMHATHRFFLTNRSLYLLVLDGRKGASESNIQYWLEIIQSYGGNSPIIIVINKSDEQVLALDETRLKLDYAANLRCFIQTSARSGKGMDALKAAIREQLGELRHIKDPVPASYFAVKEQLEALSDKSDFVTSEDYVGICESHGVTKPRDQISLLRFLHDLGNVLNYNDPNDPYGLDDTNILNPEWVTGGVYKILNDRDLLLAGGTLDRADVERILDGDPRYPKERHDFILGMMKKFELCFELPDAAGQKLLVPELLHPKEVPTNLDVALALNFRFDYSVLPEGIIPRFIAGMHHALDDWRLCWRRGVILNIESTRAVVRADTFNNRILVSVDGPPDSRRGALSVIRDRFKAIHASVPHLSVTEMVPLPDAPEIAVSYRHLLKLERNRETVCWPDETENSYLVSDLLNGIEDAERRRRDRDRKREIGDLDRPYRSLKTPPDATPAPEKPPADSPSLLKMFAVLIGLFIALIATLILAANLLGDNIENLLVIGGVAVVVFYAPALFVLRSTNMIGEKTFEKLSLGLLNKVLKGKKDDG
jgi:internalin A